MEQTAINKPLYDALLDSGASEDKATEAAKSVLPYEDAARKSTVDARFGKLETFQALHRLHRTGNPQLLRCYAKCADRRS